MRLKLFITLVGLSIGIPLLAQSVDESLTIQMARKTLQGVMNGIASDIEALRDNYPQLKKWRKANISSSKIAYRYHFSEEEFGKNGCDLLITAKDDAAIASSGKVLPELNIGVYLKFKAVGERAEELKQAIHSIVAKRFEAVRKLHTGTIFRY